MASQNLYANKIYVDNPTALWTLDDTISGATPVSLSSLTGLSAYGVPSSSYGFYDNPGYYICSTSNINSILAENSGIPMVYGASNITKLSSGSGLPSLIIPGYGLMHDKGKNKRLTVEMWIKVTSSSKTEKRIFGPIGTTDGLYVDGPFLSLKIANSVGSYYVSEWERPMLIHISYTDEAVVLMINGETVLSVGFDISLTQFSTTDNLDWLGFYSYSDIPSLQVDCISIYPYSMSQKHAKLHFVHGQAVDNSQQKNTSYSDVPMTIDYQVSKAANNYNYPDHARWRDGFATNLSTDNSGLSFDSTQKPTTYFNNSDIDIYDWNFANDINNQKAAEASTLYFRMKPQEFDENNNNALISGLYWDIESYIALNSLDVPGFITNGIYLTAKADRFSYLDYPLEEPVTTKLSSETLLKITDNLNNYLEVSISYPDLAPATQVATVSYKYNNETLSSFTVDTTTKFSIGFDINKFVDYNNNSGLVSFFNNRDSLFISFGGNKNYTKTFSGKIYSFGLLSQKDLNQLTSSEINNDGTIKNTSTSFGAYVGSYSAKPTNTYGVFGIDISANGYWTDVVAGPLLAKEITDTDGITKIYGIDFIQLNIDYPEYASTTDSPIRSYVRFLNISDTDLMSSVNTSISVPANGLINPGVDWQTERYEFINGNILYIPSGTDINSLSIKIEIEITAKNIIRNPIKIKTLQLSSRAFDKNTNASAIVGTKFGKDITVFGTDKSFRIYKKTSPYFYLSKDSGIQLLGTTFDGTRGISIPINKTQEAFYQVSTVQFAAMYKESFVDGTSYPILKIVTPSKTINVSAVGIAGNKATLLIDDGSVYINGQLTTSGSPIPFKPNEWNIFTLDLLPLVDFGVTGGSIQIVGKFLVNNVSDHQISEIRLVQSTTYTIWDAYDGTSGAPLTWDQIDGVSDGNVVGATWENDVLKPVLSASAPIGLDPVKVYEEYIGNSSILVTATESSLVFSTNEWKIYGDLSPINITSTAL